jgi:transglutaminase/protease-like cytokinesis protein 3
LKVSYKVTADFEYPVREHYFLLRPEPSGIYSKTAISSELGAISFARSRDSFGNITLTGREIKPHSSFTYETEFTYDSDAFSCKNDDIIFSFPSKYTKISEEMKSFSVSFNSPEKLCRAVFEYMEYSPNITDVNTTAMSAFALKKGVCQDFAHILISLLRFKGYTAKYVKGFKNEITENGTSHAWVEVLINGERVALDPTAPDAETYGYIKVGVGRDFADCPMERGVFIGGGKQNQRIELKIYD